MTWNCSLLHFLHWFTIAWHYVLFTVRSAGTSIDAIWCECPKEWPRAAELQHLGDPLFAPCTVYTIYTVHTLCNPPPPPRPAWWQPLAQGRACTRTLLLTSHLQQARATSWSCHWTGGSSGWLLDWIRSSIADRGDIAATELEQQQQQHWIAKQQHS